MQKEVPVVKMWIIVTAHTHKGSEEGINTPPQNEIVLPPKVSALWNANEAIRELKIWQQRAPTWEQDKLTVRPELAEMSEALRANTAPRAPTYKRSLSASSNMVL